MIGMSERVRLRARHLPRFLHLLRAMVTVVTISISAPALAISLPGGFTEQIISSGLSGPVGMAFLQDERLLIIEQQSGKVKVWAEGTGLNSTAILTVAGLNTNGGERGLLGIAVDPQFPVRPYVYLFYDHVEVVNSLNVEKIRVSRYEVGGPGLNDPASTNLTISNEVVLLHDIPDNASNHNGGTLRFGPDDNLYISIGDDADQCAAQDLIQLKGKILRINVNGVTGTFDASADRAQLDPGNNPFSGDANLNKRLIWDYGLRNPFRFSIDPANGRVYVGDVGSNDFEEASEGSAPGDHGTNPDNFAWPFYEGGLDQNKNCTGVTKPPNYAPMLVIDHDDFGTLSIIGGPVYRGNPYPNNISNDISFPLSFEGVYFASEYFQNFLLARQWNPTTSTWDINTFATGLSGGSADWTVGPDGGLYYVSQSTGSIRKITYTALDFDRDGILDSADDDDDNDGLSDLFEDANGLFSMDTDSDDDGIMDGLDPVPGTPSNACTGDDATFNTVVDSMDTTCAAKESVTVQSSVEVQAGYLLHLISPTVELKPGFSVTPSSQLSIISVDPGAVGP